LWMKIALLPFEDSRPAAALCRSRRRGRPAIRLSRRKSVPADLRKDAGAFDLPIALGDKQGKPIKELVSRRFGQRFGRFPCGC